VSATDTKVKKAPAKKGAKKAAKVSLYQSSFNPDTGEWETGIDENAVAELEEKRKKAEALRKQRDELLKKVVSEKGGQALNQIDPLTVSFRLVEGTDLTSIDAFMNPCIEVTPSVHPLMDACLQKVGMTRRGRRSYSISLGKHTDSKSLLALFNALPGEVIYTPEELEKVTKKGEPNSSNYTSISQLQKKLADTEAGAKTYGLYNAIASRMYQHSARPCQSHWAIQAATNGKELFLRFITFGDKESKGEAMFLYDGSPNLNLLKREATSDPILVTADVAVALYDSAAKFGFEVESYDWMTELTETMKNAVIAQAIPGSPGEARLIVGVNVPTPKGITLTPMGESGEILFTQDTADNIGKAMEKLTDETVIRVIHPSVADVIRMERAPLVEYRELNKRPYQNEVVRRHASTEIGFVNTAAVGLGKTVMTLFGCKVRYERQLEQDSTAPYRALVVMQMDKLDDWNEEAARHFPECRTFILHGKKKATLDKLTEELADAEICGEPIIVFTSYETVKDTHEYLKQWNWDSPQGGWDTIAVDESVVLVSTSAARSKAMWDLRKAGRVGIALTGTPIERGLDDLGRMLAWARGEEEMFYGRRLSTRYDVTQESNVTALHRSLGPTVVRFDRSDLARAAAADEDSDDDTTIRLPKIVSHVVALEPSKPEKALADGTRKHMKTMYLKMVEKYEEAAQLNPDDELLAEAKDDLRSVRGAVLGSVTLSRIGASDPRALLASDSLGVTLLDVEGLIDPVVKGGSTKGKWLIKTLEGHIAKKESALVFTDFSSVATRVCADLKEAGMRVAAYTGSVNRAKRTELRQRFMGRPCEKHEKAMVTGAVPNCKDCKQPDLDVLVLTKAAYKGLNLQRAAVLVHYDLPWMPSDVVQRLGRASRDGAHNEILTVYVPLMKGTIEERVAALLLPRAITAMQVLDGHRGVDLRETELGMSMKGLAEEVSVEEQGGNISMFELAKTLLAEDDDEAAKKIAKGKTSKKTKKIAA
jgi:hypothetical protein